MKRILITGASRGIGREAALELAKRGYAVVLAARDEAALRGVASECGDAEVAVMDVTDDVSVQRALASLRGPIDVLVNNAGSCDQRTFARQPELVQRAEMELNYWGALRVTRALLPMLVARSGTIVNVSSLLGTIASPTTANYGATKAALEAWSHALRGEYPSLKVSVFVAPHTDTPMGRAVHFEGVTSLPVRYTAAGLVRAIERAPRKISASPVYDLLLLLWRLFPRFMESRVARSARPALACASPAPSRADAPDAARPGR